MLERVPAEDDVVALRRRRLRDVDDAERLLRIARPARVVRFDDGLYDVAAKVAEARRHRLQPHVRPEHRARRRVRHRRDVVLEAELRERLPQLLGERDPRAGAGASAGAAPSVRVVPAVGRRGSIGASGHYRRSHRGRAFDGGRATRLRRRRGYTFVNARDASSSSGVVAADAAMTARTAAPRMVARWSRARSRHGRRKTFRGG
mmetsp:Transcript_5120/g.15611  ORF Transcript_5120/g.15611 Transcript_5120/m.15611 type:complete len:204 (-) Transcript_5120:977-1588(-)